MYPVPPNAKYAGRSEEICGKWLQNRPRDSVIVASKVAGPGGGWFLGPLRSGHTGLDRHNIERAVEESLRRLGTDYIDLYQTHWPDPDFPIDETLEALDRLVEEGKIRYIGCSNESAYGLTKSLWAADRTGTARYETIQNNFSLLNRRFEDELANVCRREQVSLLPYSPIAGGVLSGKYQGGAFPDGARFSLYKQDAVRGATMTRRFINERSLESTERFAVIAAEAGMSIATFATVWSLSHDFVASTLIGATTPEQLDETLAATGKTLPADVLAACDAVSTEIRYPLG
jgi:aryl-alcohol dehydrogenase-like predicted oxidoreductase